MKREPNVYDVDPLAPGHRNVNMTQTGGGVLYLRCACGETVIGTPGRIWQGPLVPWREAHRQWDAHLVANIPPISWRSPPAGWGYGGIVPWSRRPVGPKGGRPVHRPVYMDGVAFRRAASGWRSTDRQGC